MPDFVESQRNKMAERAGEDVSGLFDAARWFWLDRAFGVMGMWPGQQSAQNCTAYYRGNYAARKDLFDKTH